MGKDLFCFFLKHEEELINFTWEEIFFRSYENCSKSVWNLSTDFHFRFAPDLITIKLACFSIIKYFNAKYKKQISCRVLKYSKYIDFSICHFTLCFKSSYISEVFYRYFQKNLILVSQSYIF